MELVEKAMVEVEKWVDFNMSVPDIIEANHPVVKFTLLAQAREEIEGFGQVIEKMDKRSIALETGVFYGGTFYFWKQFFDHVIGIDINPKSCEFVTRRLKDYGCDPATHDVICGDAFELATKDKVLEILKGRPIDMLFIDGSHSCRAMMNEFLCYGSLVRPGGIIGFHDVGQEAFPVEGPIPKEEMCHLYAYRKGVWAHPRMVFAELNCCARHIMIEHEKYGVTRMQFIHPLINRSGIGWCQKL